MAGLARLESKLVKGIREYFAEQGKTKSVIGLSGGIDSAVTFALLCKALGHENVTALIMPNTGITKKANVADAENLSWQFKAKYYIVPIDEFYHSFSKLPWQQTSIAKANLNARIRAVILYNYANSNNALVAGTGNKSEFWMGYFTKYGDAAADFFPIANLLKKQVRALAVHQGLPHVFLEKTPSAELWVGQEDEKEMGITYDELDELLPLILKREKTPKEKKSVAGKIRSQIRATEHKRKPPKIMEIE